MEDVVCLVCAEFEPQTWRKSLCKNCFHTNEEHTEEVNPTPPVTQKYSTPESGTEKLSVSKTNNGNVPKAKSTPKSSSAPSSPKFGATKSKGKDNDKTDNGKLVSKPTADGSKTNSEPVKRVAGGISKHAANTTTRQTTGTDKKQNGKDIKFQTSGSKDSTIKYWQKSGDKKTGDAKVSHSSDSAQVSHADSPKSAGSSSSRCTGAVGASKVKNLLRSFGSEDRPADASGERRALYDFEKHPTTTDSDVTSKCQASEGNQVTSKTLVTGKEKESASATVVRTVPISTGSSRSVNIPSSRSVDASVESGSKSPSITIRLRSGVADVKVGKTGHPKSKVEVRVDEKNSEKARKSELLEFKAKEQELLELKAKEKELLAKEKEFNELKAREKELREFKLKERELKAKEKEYQILLTKEKELDKLKCKEREIRDKENEIKNLKLKEQELRNLKAKENDIKAKESEIREQEKSLAQLKAKLIEMEKKCKQLEDENITLKRSSVRGPKEDAENLLEELRQQLSTMESRCMKLESDNTSLMTGLKEKEEAVRKDGHGRTKEMLDLSQKFRDSEKDLCQVEDENAKLRLEIRELREEMDEMYDTFRENEVDEFRDLQKELEITAKNCRILQFKLRKAERRNEQVESDKTMYEERLRILQNQFESEDTRAHIRKVEEELKMAKEVSVRLHDEIDLLEDKKCKAEEDSRHLTELLEQADKKQFRMEMEIDKLRDQIMDLKQELKYAGKHDSQDRKAMLGNVGKQGSGDYDLCQVKRDLYDSVERENDLREQLRFTEEETKMMRKKLSELEEENESLNMQIRKMSRNNKRRELKEKERFTKESEELDSDTDSSGDIDVKIQCELLEQELAVSRKKISDAEQESENLREEVQFLQEKLEEKTLLLNVKPEPSSPNAYYEDKIKQITMEVDDLKWKIIEKERETERLCAQMNFIQHSHRHQQGKLKKSKSLDSDTQEVSDLRKQLEQLSSEAAATKERLLHVVTQNEVFASENQRLKLQLHRQIPSVHADDAAVENIELKDKVKKLDDDNRSLQDRIKTLTDSLQTLTKDTRSRSAEVPHIPESRSSDVSRDSMKHLESLQAENTELRRKMAELESVRSRGSSEEAIQKTDDQKAIADDRENIMDKNPEDMTRLQLVEKVLDLEDEILDLRSVIKHKELDRSDVDREVSSLKQHIEETDEMWRKKERDMVEEMEMMHEKNSVLSNLLEIVTERADRAEQEIEILMKERADSDRSASQVSALSNASVGSDDVFLSPPPSDKSPIIHRDWDRQMKKRVESLERLLAEERLKVATAEKKLLLVTQETISTAMSDDSKLHLREKELLQHELIESQKHLKIATDQIKGMKERLHATEEEHTRLKIDYGRVCEQLDHLENNLYDSDKTPEGNIEHDTPKAHQKKPLPPLKIPHRQSSLEAMTLEQKCAMYKLKAEELQYKVEEINDIWRSKSAASEKEKHEIETEFKKKNEDIRVMSIMFDKVKDELCEKEKAITISETTIKEKTRAITRRDEILQEQDEALKQRDHDFQTIMEQISHRDETIRELREAVRNRDERLREKDDILCKLNDSLDNRKRDVKMLSNKIKECGEQLHEKEAVICVLQQQISHNTQQDTGSETDIEKVNARLKESLRKCQSEKEDLTNEKQKVEKDLQTSRKALDEVMLLWDKDKIYFESTINVADEKLKLYETLPSMNKQEIEKAMKSDAQQYFKEKEKLACDLNKVKMEHESAIKNLKQQNIKLHNDVEEKERQLQQKKEIVNKQERDIDRLSGQAEMAYQLQQAERVMRAEYLATKVRYETRFEKMSKDYTKMLVTIEKLQKERDLDKAIIQGIQKGMSSLKDNYSSDLVKWDDEKALLERQIKEIDETRELAADLQKKVQNLKEQMSEQDRSRTDMVNKFATERSSWDLERANLRSKINQMEEKLSVTCIAQTRTKDIHNHMEIAWEKERTEQKRLLEKAHNLALDLQEQLKARDESYSHERRDLLRQLETERQACSREKKERNIAMAEYESCGKKLVLLQQRSVELTEKHQKACEDSVRERNNLMKQLAESKNAHALDSKRLSDVLSNLVRLREIAKLVSERGTGTTPKPSETSEDTLTQKKRGKQDGELDDIDKTVMKYIKEILVDITSAVDISSIQTSALLGDQAGIRRSLSSSEIDLLKEEATDIPREGENLVIMTTKDGSEKLSSHLDVASRLQKSNTFDANTKTRPKTLQKSVSMDATTSTRQMISHESHVTSLSVSAGASPTDHYAPSQFPSGVTSCDGVSLSLPQVGSLDRLSPRSARRKFFEEKPGPDVGFLSWPERKHHQSVYQKELSSLPDPSEVRKVAEEDYTALSKSESKSSMQMKTSLSWNENMHYTVIQTEISKEGLQQQKQAHSPERVTTACDKPPTTRERPRFFKKSSSLEGPVGNSLAKIGTQAMPVAAPTGFTPTDILSTVRGKFKLPFKKFKDFRSLDSTSSPATMEPLHIAHPSALNPTPPDTVATPVSLEKPFPEQRTSSDPRGRSHHGRSNTDTPHQESKWRARSAERLPSASPLLPHSDVITASQVWRFSETAV